MPRFSFIVTCYNYERYIVQCLNSILEQEGASDWEAICVDDGSTDSSLDILAGYEKKDGRVRVIAKENEGLESACNAGIRLAASPYIVRVDADDFLERNFLKVMEAGMAANPGNSFYYVREYSEFYDDGEDIRKRLPDFDKEEIFCRGDFFATATIYTKAHLEGIGLFPTAKPNCGLENYTVVLALLSAGFVGVPVSGTGFFYRRHRKNMSTVKRQNIIEYGRSLLAEYGREYKTNQYHPYGLVL